MNQYLGFSLCQNGGLAGIYSQALAHGDQQPLNRLFLDRQLSAWRQQAMGRNQQSQMGLQLLQSMSQSLGRADVLPRFRDRIRDKYPRPYEDAYRDLCDAEAMAAAS